MSFADDLRGLEYMNLLGMRNRVAKNANALQAVEAEIARRGAVQVDIPRRSVIPAHLQNEGDVEQDVDSELVKYGWSITRFSQPRASKQTPGIPDRYCRHVPRHLRMWCEVKQPGGVLSDDQKRWQKEERDAGGDAIVVFSLIDLWDELEARGFEVERR